MSETEFAFPTLLDAAAALRQGQITSSELTRCMLERIARVDDYYKAYAAVMRTLAMQEAEQSDREIASGLTDPIEYITAEQWDRSMNILLRDQCSASSSRLAR